MDPYRIFFSHRHRDEPVTKEIIGVLHRHTENVRCFISENIERGAKWRSAIAEQLKLSGFLVLVFTDPEEDWGWCLYETGFFDALSQLPGETRRIYCLHHPSTTPPTPIADLQTIPATSENVRQWLEELFEKTNQSKQEFRDDLPSAAEKICGLIQGGRKSVYVAKSINIHVKRSLLKSPDDLPEDTMIQGEDGLMAEVFGTSSGRIDWKSAKNRFSQFPNSSEINFRALKEISRAAYCIGNDNRLLPIQGTIFVGNGPKRYRPVISHAKEIAAETINVEILLIEDVGGPLQNVDKDFGVLLTTMRMALRIRWEIVRPFASRISPLARLDPRKLRFDLQTCLNNIFSEAEFRGTFSVADVWTAFDDPGDKERILQMISSSGDVFGKLWQSIGFSNPTETFGEVSSKPFNQADELLLEKGLTELRQMNSDFLEMATVRLQNLVRREIGSAKTNAKGPGRPAGPAKIDASLYRPRPPAREKQSSSAAHSN